MVKHGTEELLKLFGKKYFKKLNLIAVPVHLEKQKGQNSWQVTFEMCSLAMKPENSDIPYLALLQTTESFDKATYIPNNYKVGRSFEYRCMQKYARKGWYVKRSYASKGLEDFIAYQQGDMHFIQCKFSRKNATYSSQHSKELKKLKEKALSFGAIPVFAGVHENRKLYFFNLLTKTEFIP